MEGEVKILKQTLRDNQTDFANFRQESLAKHEEGSIFASEVQKTTDRNS